MRIAEDGLEGLSRVLKSKAIKQTPTDSCSKCDGLGSIQVGEYITRWDTCECKLQEEEVNSCVVAIAKLSDGRIIGRFIYEGSQADCSRVLQLPINSKLVLLSKSSWSVVTDTGGDHD